ncbi:PREDICTED: uncharacterized protein LOC103334313 [Prunus mume]|uniref:Uncharacterized protein LOC103334313 n=1 Tax=Prunus mume TaxID=102107 RepID=A0ABM0P7K2_PRUMU|nr:PREDICTED: uncharacterized protein LOC103334313 [Prunus mume]
MASKNDSLEIPDGWVLNTRVEEDGTEVKGFLCPETGQEFSTYQDLMRYVRYAKAAQLSIYSPDSNFMKAKRAKAAKESSSGLSSNSAVTEHGEKNNDPTERPCSTQNPGPKRKGKASTSKGKKRKQQPKRK